MSKHVGIHTFLLYSIKWLNADVFFKKSQNYHSLLLVICVDIVTFIAEDVASTEQILCLLQKLNFLYYLFADKCRVHIFYTNQKAGQRNVKCTPCGANGSSQKLKGQPDLNGLGGLSNPV